MPLLYAEEPLLAFTPVAVIITAPLIVMLPALLSGCVTCDAAEIHPLMVNY